MKIDPYLRNMAKRKEHRPQKGSALLAALCLVFMAGMLTGSVLMISRITTFDVYAHVQLQRSAYINEGVGNRIAYLIAADRQVNSSSTRLGELDYTEYDYDRFTADGIPHIIDYHGTPVQVTLTDAVSGFDLSSSAYRSTLSRIASALELDDNEIRDKTDALTARIQDYLDTDDNLTDDGMEHTEYESASLQGLPRNGNMYYREELAFIPDLLSMFAPDKDGFFSSVRVFTPEGMTSINANGSRPSIITASPLVLKVYGNLEDEEVQEIVEARKEWFKNKTPLTDQLDALLLGRLYNSFSFNESGFFTVQICTPPDEVRPSRKLNFTFPAFGVSGPQNRMLNYYDWVMF